MQKCFWKREILDYAKFAGWSLNEGFQWLILNYSSVLIVFKKFSVQINQHSLNEYCVPNTKFIV